jgi:hypothetical protein
VADLKPLTHSRQKLSGTSDRKLIGAAAHQIAVAFFDNVTKMDVDLELDPPLGRRRLLLVGAGQTAKPMIYDAESSPIP